MGVAGEPHLPDEPPEPRLLLADAARRIRGRDLPDTTLLALEVDAAADVLSALRKASQAQGVPAPMSLSAALLRCWALSLTEAAPPGGEAG